jgi:hypothetical protein
MGNILFDFYDRQNSNLDDQVYLSFIYIHLYYFSNSHPGASVKIFEEEIRFPKQLTLK